MNVRSAIRDTFQPALGLALGAALLAPVLAAQTQPPPPPPATKPPARVRAKLDGFELSPKSGKSPNQVGGASRDLGTPALFAPNAGKCFTTAPTFYWTMMESDSKVAFKLTTADGQAIYETATTANHLKYPADAPALTPGSSYKWTIVPENDLLGGAPAAAAFLVVNGPERDQIQNELKSASDASAAAKVFVAHRLWYDAVQSYSDLLDHKPADQSARAARAELYDQLPVTKSLADADWRMVH